MSKSPVVTSSKAAKGSKAGGKSGKSTTVAIKRVREHVSGAKSYIELKIPESDEE